MSQLKKYLYTFFAFSGLFLTFDSCIKKDPESKIAQVLLVHLSPNAAAADFSVNGTLYAAAIPYTTQTASTFTSTIRYTLPYYTVEPKTGSTIAYNLTGTPTALASGTKDLQDEKVYSTFLIDSANKLKVAIVNDDLSDPTSGKVKIRFFHFSANTVPLDVSISGGTGKLFTNRSFNDQVTSTEYEKFIEINPGVYTFLFTNNSTGATVYTTSSQTLLPDRIYTIAARGFTGGTGTLAIGAWVYPNKP